MFRRICILILILLALTFTRPYSADAQALWRSNGGSVAGMISSASSINQILSTMASYVGKQWYVVIDGFQVTETIPVTAYPAIQGYTFTVDNFFLHTPSLNVAVDYMDSATGTWLVYNELDGVGSFATGFSTPADISSSNPADFAASDPTIAGTFGLPNSPSGDPTQQSSKSCGNPVNITGEPSVGEPINVATGNVYNDVIDYQTATSNPLKWERCYNSRGDAFPIPGSMGSNWRTSYDRTLWIGTNLLPTQIQAFSNILPVYPFIAAKRGDGQVIYFRNNAGVWTTDSDVNLKLRQSGTNWIMTDVQGDTETYTMANATQAALSTIQYRDGYKETLSYDSNQHLNRVSDSYGRSLQITFSNNLLQTVTTPDGLVLTYGYDSSGQTGSSLDRLSSVTYSTTPQTSQQYLYENSDVPFALTGVIDENGNRYMSWTYDDNARGLTSQIGNGALLTTVTYNDTDGSRTAANALGQTDVYKFATLQGIPKVTEIDRLATATTSAASKLFTYDGNGYTATETDWNHNVTNYVNDTLGRPTSMVEAYGTSLARTTTVSYFAGLDLPLQIVTPNLTSAFQYDSSANLLTKTLTDTTTTTVPYSTKGQTRTWTYTWNNGLLTSVQNPRTDVRAITNFAYDTTGALITTTNALGQTTQVTQHTPGGLPLTIVDENGVTSQLTYDARSRLTSSTIDTTAGNLETQYAHDAAGNVVNITLPDGSATTNSYDTAHRLISVTDLLGQTTSYTLDALGDRTATTLANAAHVVKWQHTSSFDALGRIITDTGGAGQTSHLTYDANGNNLSLTDPLNHSEAQAFDALNRLTAITDPASAVTTTTYDTQDHPKIVTAPNNGKTTYIYDGFSDVIEQSSPDTHNTVFLYNPDGKVTEKIDQTGATVNLTYDALDRVKTEIYPADTAENVTNTYDAPGAGFGVGRLTSVADAAGTLARTFDERGNILSETRTIGSAVLVTGHTYDAAGRVATITYPSGVAVSYIRDVMGRIIAVTLKSHGTSSTVVSNISYEPFGPITSLSFGNGVVETQGYDGDYRATSIDDVGLSSIQNLTYGYDAANNVLSLADGVTPENTQAFQYDSLNRLTGADGGYGNLSYTYDNMSNRLTQSLGSAVTTYGYTPATNHLLTVASGGSSETISYTTTGNISSTGNGMGFGYNQAGRLENVTSNSQSIAS